MINTYSAQVQFESDIPTEFSLITISIVIIKTQHNSHILSPIEFVIQ
ncbi:hypothetical protein PPBDW_II0300 [Photobacterium kishitanii]|nr:hypothetical protein PPBDW_II0300 [Photobacterium kishitanii]